MSGQVSNRIRYKGVVWLCLLIIIAVLVGVVLSGCGGIFDKWADEYSYSFTDNFESIGAEMQIVMSMVVSVTTECMERSPFDSTIATPDLQVVMSSWELSADGTGEQGDPEPVVEKFKCAEMMFGSDSSIWNEGMLPSGNLDNMQMEFATTGSIGLSGTLGVRYYKIYYHRETTFPLLGKLLGKDSIVSIVTSPVRIGIGTTKPKPQIIDCGKFVGYFHTEGFEVVQDSIVKVEGGNEGEI